MIDLKGLNSKKLGFGFMRLPVLNDNVEDIDYKTLNKLVDTFISNGFKYFDTAYPYHRGMSEIAIRECLVKRYKRDEFILADKLPLWSVKSEDQLKQIFDEQLEKCAVEYFDFYLLHCLGVDLYKVSEKVDAFNFIKQMKNEGKIKNIGFSFHDKPEVLDKILTEHPEMEFVQLQINYIDWDNPSIQSKACYEVAKKHNKPIIVMEPVKGGGLANLPEEAKNIFKNINKDMSMASYAIRFAASLENVFMVLSGMSTEEQLVDNISYMKELKKIDEKEKEAINKVTTILNSLNTINCTQCRYCVGNCPKKISIPNLISLYNQHEIFGGLLYLQSHYISNIKNSGKASDCIKCGKCEINCPQHLKIKDHLEDIAKTFEKTVSR